MGRGGIQEVLRREVEDEEREETQAWEEYKWIEVGA